MDISSIFGALLGAGLIVWGAREGNLITILFNWHGLAIVLGGSIAAAMVNTSLTIVRQSLGMLILVFIQPRRADPDELIALLSRLAGEAKQRGILTLSLTEAEEKICGGFLMRALRSAREQPDAAQLRLILEEEISQRAERSRELMNLYHTLSVLSPMFGLLGTLIGIVRVLKELSNPEVVGAAMAVAITSAFYGILLANLVFIPVAGKIRLRIQDEIREKDIILEGVIAIMEGAIPILVERKLNPYRQARD